jgi:DNA replication and repair protein RecF
LRITRLSLTNFRAFTRLDIEFPRRILLLIGDNAQGKTSLLESIFYLATFSSFHTQTDRQLVSFHTGGESLAVARIVAEIEKKAKSTKLEVRLILENGTNGSPRLRKEILVDGIRRKTVEALGQLNAVIFLPQMMRVLEGGPEERRRYINMVLSQVIPGYGEALTVYSRAMDQRNALLKLLSERGGDQSQLDYWDGLLAEHGSRIITARILALQELESSASGIHLKLTSDSELLRVIYQPSYDPLPIPPGQPSQQIKTLVDRSSFSQQEIRDGFQKQLAAQRNEEIRRGVTIIGPHRDELRLTANGMDLGDFGSRGQVRTALLAIKLAEVDPSRREDLLASLNGYEQAILTATDLSHFPAEFIGQCEQWIVTAGNIATNSEE